jgi:hypothetical protein
MSDDKLVPVHPARDDKGRLKALFPFAGEDSDEALPFPQALADEDLAHKKLLVNFFQTSASTASKLGVMGSLAMSSDYLHDAAIFEILVGIHKIRSGDVTNHLVRETFWGSSIRIAMRVKAKSASATGSFGLLAASVELGTARVEYEISTVGAVTPAMLATALGGMPIFGTLSFDAYTQFTASAQKIAHALMDEAILPPVPVAVKLKYHPAAGAMLEALTMRYAMIAITHEKPLDAALHDAPRDLDPAVIVATYTLVLRTASALTGAHAEEARSWLNA